MALIKKVVAKITGIVKQAEKSLTIDEEINKVLEKPTETKPEDKKDEIK